MLITKGKGKGWLNPKNWEDYCQLEASYNEAEDIRLLYVAADSG